MSKETSIELFCIRQQKRLRTALNLSLQRVRNARRRRAQAVHDEWELNQPRCIGHAIGQRKKNLDELEQ